MGRIRTIKPEFPQSESMGRISRDARLLFVLLWTLVDDEGRTRGASRMIASLLFPYDEDAPRLVEGWMTELEGENCIVRYLVEGASYLQVLKWSQHQKIDHASRSKIPAFDESSRILARPLESSRLIKDQGSRIKDQDQGPLLAPSPSASTPAAEEFLSFPCVGKGAKTYSITIPQVERWEADFPGVDVRAALRKMRAWIEANPTKRKTAKGIPAFVVNWLGRDQDAPLLPSGPPRAGGGPAKRSSAPVTPAPTPRPPVAKTWETREREIRDAADAFQKTPEETEAWVAEERDVWIGVPA